MEKFKIGDLITLKESYWARNGRLAIVIGDDSCSNEKYCDLECEGKQRNIKIWFLKNNIVESGWCCAGFRKLNAKR